jgi:hypothetical protein
MPPLKEIKGVYLGVRNSPTKPAGALANCDRERARK